MKTSSKFIVAGLLVLVLGVTVIGIPWYVRRTAISEQKHIAAFILEVMASARDETNFYKNHVDEEILSNFEGYVENITTIPEVLFIDYDWGLYDYRVVFDSDNRFMVGVIQRDEDYIIVYFKQEYSGNIVSNE